MGRTNHGLLSQNRLEFEHKMILSVPSYHRGQAKSKFDLVESGKWKVESDTGKGSRPIFTHTLTSNELGLLAPMRTFGNISFQLSVLTETHAPPLSA
jgi:hypothetical protein